MSTTALNTVDLNDREHEESHDDDELFLKSCKCTNQIFHGLDILIGLFVLCQALLSLADIDRLAGFLLPAYFAIFGCFICGLAIHRPPWVITYCPFYFTFIGRGIAFLLLGSVILAFEHGFSIATGVITILQAFVYFACAVWSQWFRANAVQYGFDSLPPPIVTHHDGVDGKEKIGDEIMDPMEKERQRESAESEVSVSDLSRDAGDRDPELPATMDYDQRGPRHIALHDVAVEVIVPDA